MVRISTTAASATNPGTSLVVKQDLAKLDKSPESRRSALQSLRACVEQLDQSSMPRFLQQVGDSRDSGTSADSSSRAYHAISLYEDVARHHGKLIRPHLPRIMATVGRSLSSSGSSPHLPEACAKVVGSILRYCVTPEIVYHGETRGGRVNDSGSLGRVNDNGSHGRVNDRETNTIDYAGSDHGKTNDGNSETDGIFRDVCNPLLESLVSKLGPLARGSALCLQAVVESEKWKYVPKVLEAEMGRKSTLALKERVGQTVEHMQLARSIARITGKARPEVVQSARDLLMECKSSQSSTNWQLKVAVLQLLRDSAVNLDPNSASGLELRSSVLQVVEELRQDRMPHVRKEATKTSDTLKKLRFKEELQPASSTSSQESQVVSCSPPPVSSASSSVSRLHQSKMPLSSASSTSGASEVGSPSPTRANGKSVWCMTPASADRSEICSLEDEDDCCRIVLGRNHNGVSRYSQVKDDEDAGSTTIDHGIADVQSSEAAEDLLVTPQNLEKKSSVLTTEDFMRFTTPRRLVRSLQAYADSPTPGPGPAGPDSFSDNEDVVSETWSVRDNPIADDYHETETLPSPPPEPDVVADMEAEMESVSEEDQPSWKSRVHKGIEKVFIGFILAILLVYVTMILMRIVLNSTQDDDPYMSLVPT